MSFSRTSLARCTTLFAWQALIWLLLAAPAGASPLVTRWASSVSPTNVLPEYPRPQMVRDQWQNLNGLWDYCVTTNHQRLFTKKILVPFPVESHLSGVEQPLDEQSTLWYRTFFTVPKSWQGQRLQLHFGAVDWSTEVVLNARLVGKHRGGYDAFTFDISSQVHWDRTNELLVAVKDPTEADQPRGKQSRRPEGIFYTPSSGIWQTVWLEPVPPVHITELNLVPDLTAQALRARVHANTLAEDVQTEITVTLAGLPAGRSAGPAGAEIVVPLTVSRPWSPDRPTLYDLGIVLRRGNEVLDRVRSYFGLREIRLGTDEAGQHRLFLNGQPLFEMGVLDQGFWPDGLYTAPTDEARKFDLETARQLGFNLVRKHVKVEPERWYYWADKLGLLVWQDMPSANNTTEAGRRQFEMELQRMVEQHANHPSIVMWVLFNEGWGQPQSETERLVHRIKVMDPTRLVDNASGWTDLKVGDVLDLHSYPEPIAPPAEQRRAAVLGEFGGLSLKIENHTWSEQTWGYQTMSNATRLTDQCCSLLEKIWVLQKDHGLAAAVYTQLVDVETECNGFLTYDREVLKINPTHLLPLTSRVPMLVPTAQQNPGNWSYTTNDPGPSWAVAEFSTKGWSTGKSGYGDRKSPGSLVNTLWANSDIWLRRDFTADPAALIPSGLLMYHDEDAEVYLNGVLVTKVAGFTVNYDWFEVPKEARRALRPGRNVLAVHCHQTSGGQYIDVGLAGQVTGRD